MARLFGSVVWAFSIDGLSSGYDTSFTPRHNRGFESLTVNQFGHVLIFCQAFHPIGQAPDLGRGSTTQFPKNICSSTAEHWVRKTQGVGSNPTGCKVPGLVPRKIVGTDWFLTHHKTRWFVGLCQRPCFSWRCSPIRLLVTRTKAKNPQIFNGAIVQRIEYLATNQKIGVRFPLALPFSPCPLVNN